MNACFCVGPQNGEPLCPCRMSARSAKDRRLDYLERRVKELERGSVMHKRLGDTSSPAVRDRLRRAGMWPSTEEGLRKRVHDCLYGDGDDRTLAEKMAKGHVLND